MSGSDVLNDLLNPYINEEARELRNRLAKQAAENHAAFARLGHAAHEVCGL